MKNRRGTRRPLGEERFWILDFRFWMEESGRNAERGMRKSEIGRQARDAPATLEEGVSVACGSVGGERWDEEQARDAPATGEEEILDFG